MPIHTPTPGQQFILKLAFGERLSDRAFIEFTDPRNGTYYRYSEVDFYRFLIVENRVRGPSGGFEQPQGLLASLGRRSGKSNLITTMAQRFAQRRVTCAITTLGRDQSQVISNDLVGLHRDHRSFVRIGREVDTRSSVEIVDELGYNSELSIPDINRLLNNGTRFFAFSSPRPGSVFDRLVLNPPTGVVSVMMHTWEVMGQAAILSNSLNDHLGSQIPVMVPGTDGTNFPRVFANRPSQPSPPPPPVVEERQVISESERFEQVMSGLDESEETLTQPVVRRPPCDLYVVVNQDADDCLCVTNLDRLHSQERFRADRVYRVVAMEEVEDPREELDEPAASEAPIPTLRSEFEALLNDL